MARPANATRRNDPPSPLSNPSAKKKPKANPKPPKQAGRGRPRKQPARIESSDDESATMLSPPKSTRKGKKPGAAPDQDYTPSDEDHEVLTDITNRAGPSRSNRAEPQAEPRTDAELQDLLASSLGNLHLAATVHLKDRTEVLNLEIAKEFAAQTTEQMKQKTLEHLMKWHEMVAKSEGGLSGRQLERWRQERADETARLCHEASQKAHASELATAQAQLMIKQLEERIGNMNKERREDEEEAQTNAARDLMKNFRAVNK